MSARQLLADRAGAVGILFGLLAPLLVLAVAFGIDVTGWYRDALHLQGVADRAAISAGPLWLAGDTGGARAIAAAIVADDGGDTTLESSGSPPANPRAFAVAVSCPKQHLLVGLVAPGRYTAWAVAQGGRLIE